MIKFLFLAVFLGGGAYAINKFMKIEDAKEGSPLNIKEIDLDGIFEEGYNEEVEIDKCKERRSGQSIGSAIGTIYLGKCGTRFENISL